VCVTPAAIRDHNEIFNKISVRIFILTGAPVTEVRVGAAVQKRYRK
jgi:hypothetical protein